MVKMKQLQISRRGSWAESRRVPLNTVILPPISPPLLEKEPQFIGKLTVNKSKSGNVNGEIVLPRAQEIASRNGELPPSGTENARVTQLEQNIRFLQEQHQLMLAGLHTEIESLKNRNRDLQFQLAFAKDSTPSSPSSPEDECKHKIYSSPKPFNTTPLQVEILEKELGELKLQMQEVESRNVYLSAIVDEQKKKLERYERDREKEREQWASSQTEETELLRKLDDAEAMIRRLKRENSDLRQEYSGGSFHRENSHQNHHHHHRENNGYQTPRSSNHQGRGNRGQRGGGNGHYRGNWFPPLHTQNFWQGGKPNERVQTGAETSGGLPSLQTNEDSTHGGGQYQGRRNPNNNYHHGDGRRYRGGNKGGKPTK